VSQEDYLKIIRSQVDEIYLSPAFGLTQTRSPEAVAARQGHARLKAKKKSVGLTPEEQGQLKLWETYIDPEEAA
jgi:hypothetical protein